MTQTSTTLLVAETITGRVAWRLPYTAMTWSSPLNKIPDCSGTAPIEDTLDALSDQRIDPRATLRAFLTGPWRYSLVPCYGSQPLMGGPLLPSDDAAASRIAFKAAGMERMLDRRVLNKVGGTGSQADPSRDVTFPNTTPAGALYRVVAEAISGRPSRRLPIVCSRIPELVGFRDFTWPSYDLTKAWKAIEDLVSGIDGPDCRLEPFLTESDTGLTVTWDLQIGNPYLPMSSVPGPAGPLPWTYPAGVAEISRTIDPAGLATTYFAAGDGQDRGKVIARSDTATLTTLGFPDLEEVEAGTGTAAGTNLDIIQGRADALAAAHGIPSSTWKAEVPVDRGLGIGAVRRGDVAQLEVLDKLYTEPGRYLRRITEVSGTAGARTATLTCEHEDDLLKGA